MSVIRIRKARMVSQAVLGIDAEVGFFHSDPKEGPRYVEIRATINGKLIEEKILVTDLVSPGEIALLEWPNQNRLKIDLTKWGISKFTEDQVFALTGIAYSETSGYSKESNIEIMIPLPVIIIHGTVLSVQSTGDAITVEETDDPSYWAPYHSLQRFLCEKGYDADSASGYRTLWGPPDIRFSALNDSSKAIAEKMSAWIDTAIKATYADKVNTVGMSVGGLIGRYYVTEYDATHVHKLVMIGTPHDGNPFMYQVTFQMPRKEAQTLLHTQKGEKNTLYWLFPSFQSLFNSDDQEILHPIKNLFHKNGYDKPPPSGINYYSIFSAERESPCELIVEKQGDWYRLIGNRETAKGDGSVRAQSAKTFGHNIIVPAKAHHAFMPGDTEVQCAVLAALRDKHILPLNDI